MTSWAAWAVRRLTATRGLMLVLLGVVTLTTAILAGSLGNASLLATRSARATLSAPQEGHAGLQLRTRLGDDPSAQDLLARDALAEAFSGAQVTVSTGLVSEALPFDGRRVVLRSGGALTPERVELTQGTWPVGADQTALQAEAAVGLGLAVGDRVDVAGRELRVTALWRPAVPDDPAWLGDPLILTGHDGASWGPLLVDASVIEATDAPFLSWTVLPEVDTLTPGQLGALADGANAAAKAVKVADTTGRGLVVTGDLAATATQAQRDAATGDAFGFIPISALLLISVVGLTQVAGLLATARARQTSLLFARGAGLRQVLGVALAESVVVALVGSLLGTSLAWLAITLVAGGASQTGTVVTGGLAGAVLSLACLGVTAVRATLAGARGHQPRPDRVRNVAGAALLVLVGILAVVATWQLRRASTFIGVDGEGGVRLDVVAALAPSLLLALSAVAALALLTPVTRLLELAMHRLGSTGIWLASAQVARGLRLHAVAVALTVLATGTATFAAFFSGTAAGISDAATTVAQATPIRVSLSTTTGDVEPPRLTGVPGVTATVPVWSGEAQIGDLRMALVAAPVEDLADIVTLPDGHSLPPAATLSPDPASERVPVALTPEAAEAASLHIGDVLEVGAFAARFPARVAAVTDVVPSVSGPQAILVDSTALTRVLAQTSTGLGTPRQLWAGFDGDPSTVKADIAALDGVASVAVTTDPGPSAPSAVATDALWVSAGCAMALAVVGLAAASASAVRARRAEVAVLRALGMTPLSQARSRAWESGAVLMLATGLGLLGGWAVSLLVAHPVAGAAAQARLGFTTALVFDSVPWLLLLTVGGLAATLVVVGQSRVVLRQAGDATWREEVR